MPIGPRPEKLHAAAEKSWQSRTFSVVLFGLFVLLLCYWWWHVPTPGRAVAVAGVAAGILTLRGEMPAWQKFAWTILLFMFLPLEFKSIDADRERYDKERQKAQQQETQAFRDIIETQRSGFAKIQSDFAETLEQNQLQFNATMQRYGEIATLSKKSLENITGGDSYAYLIPQVYGHNQKSVSLAVRNAGKQILTGVTVGVIRTAAPPDKWDDPSPKIIVGTLYPGEIRMTGASITPELGLDGVDHYWLFISAQNGLISEMVYLRPRKDDKTLWAYSFTVARVTFNKANSETRPIRWQSWTDDPKPQQKTFKEPRRNHLTIGD